MKRFLIALAMGATFATGAQAADIGRAQPMIPQSAEILAAPVPGKAINWTSFYIGGQGGYSNSNHDVSGSDIYHIPDSCTLVPSATSCSGNEADFVAAHDVSIASAFVDGFNSHGLFGGGTIGGDVQRGNVLFGVFVDYNFSSADAKAGLAFGQNFGASASIEDGDAWVVAARAGYLFGEEKRALLYVLAGYGQQDVSYHAGVTGNNNPFDKDVTFSGLVAGAGGEYALNNVVSIGIEYQHFFGGKETVFDDRGPDGNGTLVTDDMSSDRVMGRIKFKVGPGAFGY